MADENEEKEQLEAPVIIRLKIERYRGIESLTWLPSPHVNLILGGGDTGKTTILDAIGLLLNPTNATVVSDADFWKRETNKEFVIEAVMSLPASVSINGQKKANWPWEWDGENPVAPHPDDEAEQARPEVYVVRVRGTADCELAYEICQPNGDYDHFPASVRRSIGLVRLSGDDRNDRDLRLVQGSALDRLLADRALRAKLAQQIGEKDVEKELAETPKEKLAGLDKQFGAQALPSNLGLGLVGGQGFSLNALIGLTADKHATRLPLSNWGSGTRRLAALEIAAANQQALPISIIDEVERGLEPYRQRALVSRLLSAPSQTFMTTHSAAALAAAQEASIWYLAGDATIGSITSHAAPHLKRDPDAFLSRLTIIVEGATEYGFVGWLVRKAVANAHLDHGLWLTDGGGNSATLQLLESLLKSGLKFAGFADDEGDAPERWAKVKAELGNLLLRWPKGCLEENIIEHVADGDLEKLIADPDGEFGARLRTLADRLGQADSSYAAIIATVGDAAKLRTLIIAAATGSPPAGEVSKEQRKAWAAHGRIWFKTRNGGWELASKMVDLGVWPKLSDQLLSFINAIRQELGLEAIADLP